MRGLRHSGLVVFLAIFSGCTSATRVTSHTYHHESGDESNHWAPNNPGPAKGQGQVLVISPHTSTVSLDSPIGMDACNARRFDAVGRDQSLSTDFAGEYLAVLGNRTKGRYTINGHFRIDEPEILSSNQKYSDSWILVNVPHAQGDQSRWAAGRWPWVMGARVNGGVDGLSVDDHLIVHHRRSSSGTTTRLFVQGTSTQPATGKYLLSTANTPADFLESEYLRINPIGTVEKRKLSSLTEDDPDIAAQIEAIRQIAKWLRLTP